MTEKWNEWHGLTEGDMVQELVELDEQYDVPRKEAEEYWDRQNDEFIRKSWWMEIGRHEDGYRGATSTFVFHDGQYTYAYSTEDKDDV